jgi:hypothetical protein
MTDLEGSFVTNIDSLAAHYANPTGTSPQKTV